MNDESLLGAFGVQSGVQAGGPLKVQMRRSISVGRMLATYARSLNCEFLINGEPHPPVVVFSEHAFLPVVALQADLEFRSFLGNDPGTVFAPSEESLFGTMVKVDDITDAPLSVFRGLIYMQAARQIFGLAVGRRIECRPIFETYSMGLLRRAQQDADKNAAVAPAGRAANTNSGTHHAERQDG